MAINYIPADVTQGFLFEEPQKIPQLPEGKLVAYDGENILPTAEGYKSFFGISNRIGDSTLPSTEIQEIVSFVTEFGQVILLGLCGDGLWVRAAEGDGTATVTETSTEYTVAFPLGKFSWTRVVPLASASPWKLWTKVLLNNRAFFYAKGLGHILEVESLGAGNLTIKKLEPTYIISAVAKQHKIQIELDLELGNSSYKSVQIDGSYFTKYVSREADVDDFVERIRDAIGGGDISGKSLTVTQGKWNFDVPELAGVFSMDAEIKAVDGTLLEDVDVIGGVSVLVAFSANTGNMSSWLKTFLNLYDGALPDPIASYDLHLVPSGTAAAPLASPHVPPTITAPNGNIYTSIQAWQYGYSFPAGEHPAMIAWLNANRTSEMVSLGITFEEVGATQIRIRVSTVLVPLSVEWFRAWEILACMFTYPNSGRFGWFTLSTRTYIYNSAPIQIAVPFNINYPDDSNLGLSEYYNPFRRGLLPIWTPPPYNADLLDLVPKKAPDTSQGLPLNLIDPLLYGANPNIATFSFQTYREVTVTPTTISIKKVTSTSFPNLPTSAKGHILGFRDTKNAKIYVECRIQDVSPLGYVQSTSNQYTGGITVYAIHDNPDYRTSLILNADETFCVDLPSCSPITTDQDHRFYISLNPGAIFGFILSPYRCDIEYVVNGTVLDSVYMYPVEDMAFETLPTTTDAYVILAQALAVIAGPLLNSAPYGTKYTLDKLAIHLVPESTSIAEVNLSSFRHGGQKAANFNLLTQATETSPIETTSIPLPASLSTSQQIADHIYTGLHAIYPLTTVIKTAEPEATLTATITKEFLTYDGHTPIVAITKDGTETGDTISIISSTSQKMAEVDGIFKARGRLGAWKADGALHLSSPTNPMDFVPSISTQANELRIESIRGKIIQAIGSGEGFTLFNSGNVVRANYNGEQNSFNFAELYPVGIADPRHLGILGGVTYFYTPTGLMQSAGNEIQKLDYALLDYLAQFKIPLKISSAAERYLIIEITEEYLDNLFYDRLLRKGVAVSYPKAYQAPATSSSGILQPPAISLDKPYVKTFFFDTQLGKWGICTRAHKALISYAPWNVTSELISLGDNTYTAKLGAIGTDGKTYIFDEHSTDSYILFGKWGLTKRGLSRLTQVDVGFTELPKATVSIETSFEGSRIDFANVQTSQEITEETRETLHFFANGKWHNVKIAGIFELNFLNVGGFGYGR